MVHIQKIWLCLVHIYPSLGSHIYFSVYVDFHNFHFVFVCVMYSHHGACSLNSTTQKDMNEIRKKNTTNLMHISKHVCLFASIFCLPLFICATYHIYHHFTKPICSFKMLKNINKKTSNNSTTWKRLWKKGATRPSDFFTTLYLFACGLFRLFFFIRFKKKDRY